MRRTTTSLVVVSAASADMPSVLPLVETIAPTQVTMSRELHPLESCREELPKFDEMDKEDGIMGGGVPMPSTDSTESSESNRTLKTGLANPTTSVSDATVTPTVQASPVIEEEPVAPQPPSSPAINRRSSRPSLSRPTPLALECR
jgi:hypothetical protein